MAYQSLQTLLKVLLILFTLLNVLFFVWYHFYIYKVVEVKAAELPSEKKPVAKAKMETEMPPVKGMLGWSWEVQVKFVYALLDLSVTKTDLPLSTA